MPKVNASLQPELKVKMIRFLNFRHFILILERIILFTFFTVLYNPDKN
jgi:hypothetical protein